MGLWANLKRLMRTRDYYASVVRPTEEQHRDYNTKYALGDLAKRYSKYVKVAALRNAQAVAGLKLRVCREEKTRGRKVFKTTRLAPSEVRRIARGAWTRKSIDTERAYEEINDPSHPLVALLEKVNPEWNGYELIEATQLMMGLTGNFFWFDAPGAGGLPSEIWPMWPQFMDIKPSVNGLVEKYIWGRGTECMKEYEPEQITAFRNPSPFGNPWWGVGDLYACVTEADLSSSFSQAALTMVDRGAQPGLIINVPGWSEGERRQLEMALMRKADGGRNAGRSLVLSMPKDTLIQNWEMKTAEAGLFAGQSEQRARDIIAACFDMPVGLLNMEEKSLANGKVVAPLWQLYGVAPRARRIEDKINDSKFLQKFRDALGDQSLFVSFDNPIQEDESENVDFVERLYPIGVMKLDEARTKVGLEPVGGEDGDAFYQPVGPLDPNPDDDEEGAMESDGLRGEKPRNDDAKAVTVVVNYPPPLEAKAASSPAAHGAPSKAVAPCADSTCGHEHATDTKAILTTKDIPDVPDGPPRPLVSLLAAELSSAYLRVAPSIVAGMGTTGAATFTAIRDIVEDSGLPTMLVTDVAGAARPLFKDGWEKAFEGVTIPTPRVSGSFDLTNEFARESFGGYTVRLSRSITDTTARALTTAIEDGVARGATIPQLVEDVKQVMSDLSDYAAERIARTEASRAYTAGRIASWKESGIVVARKWRLSGNPCPMCVAAEEQFKSVPLDRPMVPLGGVFVWKDAKGAERRTTMDFAPVEGGDIHPQCVLGDSSINAGTVLAATRATYSGPVVEIRTASGRVLAITPNHPVLTASGFVPAKLLNQGDDLVCSEHRNGPLSSGPDNDNVPATAAQVFDSLAVSGGVSSRAVPHSPEHLHGDGLFIDGKIDVVATDGLLRGGADPDIFEMVCEDCFCNRRAELQSLSGCGDLDTMLAGLRLAAYGGIGGGGVHPVLVGSSSGRHQAVGLDDPTGNETSLRESSSNDLSGNSEPIRKSVARLTGKVCFDKVVGIEVRELSAHVYNFSTMSGAYICNGVIVHNCRCTIEAIFTDEVANAV